SGEPVIQPALFELICEKGGVITAERARTQSLSPVTDSHIARPKSRHRAVLGGGTVSSHCSVSHLLYLEVIAIRILQINSPLGAHWKQNRNTDQFAPVNSNHP
ncbi:MAG: hypothetical protein WB608_02870, partial [Terracidiphilus sp.]